MAATIFLKDNNIVIQTTQQRKLIPSNKFSIDPNGDNISVYNDNDVNLTFHYSDVTGLDDTGASVTFSSVLELEDYLSPFVNFKEGGGVGVGDTVTTLVDNGNGSFTYTNENSEKTTVDYNFDPSVLTNNVGQIKLNWAEIDRPVTALGFVANTSTPLILNSNYTVSSSPTTTYPYKSLDKTGGSDVISDSTLYLRELIAGQTIIFRVKVGYTGKAQGQNGNMIIRMYNPNSASSFEIVKSIPTPDGTTEYVEEFEFIAIADSVSLDPLYGYAFEMESTFTDNNLQGYISNITAFYIATDIKIKD